MKAFACVALLTAVSLAQTPTPAPISPVQINAGASVAAVQHGVGIVSTMVSQLDLQSQRAAEEITTRYYSKFKAEKKPLPTTLPDEVVQELADKDSAMIESYLSFELSKAHNTAVQSMHNLTANEQTADAIEFAKADGLARMHTRIADLRDGKITKDRFSAMAAYLRKLHTKLGDQPPN